MVLVFLSFSIRSLEKNYPSISRLSPCKLLITCDEREPRCITMTHMHSGQGQRVRGHSSAQMSCRPQTFFLDTLPCSAPRPPKRLLGKQEGWLPSENIWCGSLVCKHLDGFSKACVPEINDLI